MEFLLFDSLFGGLALGGLRTPWSHACLAAVLWGAAIKFPPRLKSVPAAGLWAGWLAWTALSALFSAEPLRGLAAFSHTATAVLLFAMISSYWGLESKRLWGVGLFGMGVLLGLAVLLIDTGSYGPFGLLYPYANYTAAVQAALFASCLGALGAGAGRDARTRLLLVGMMLFALALILFARSRGALAAAAAASVVWLIRRGSQRSLAAAAAAGLAAFALMPMSILTPMLKLDNVGANMRPAIWRSSMAIARDHPLLGQGPGQFERGFLRHNFPAPEGSQPTRYGLRSNHAHSEFLEIAAETGWPGLAIFLLALGVSWRRGFKIRASGDHDWSEEAAFGAFVALFTHSLVDNPLALPALKWLFFASLAVWCTPNKEKSGGTPSPGLQPVYALGLMLAALAWWPDWAVKSWRQRAWDTPGAQSLEWIESALRISPDDASLWEDLARARLRRRPPATRDAFKALSEAELRNPTTPFYSVMAAEILRKSAPAEGRWNKILALAEHALILEPNFQQARLLTAEALFHLGRRERAARELGRTAPWKDTRIPSAGHNYNTLIHHFDAERHDKIKKLIHSSAQGRTTR